MSFRSQSEDPSTFMTCGFKKEHMLKTSEDSSVCTRRQCRAELRRGDHTPQPRYQLRLGSRYVYYSI